MKHPPLSIEDYQEMIMACIVAGCMAAGTKKYREKLTDVMDDDEPRRRRKFLELAIEAAIDGMGDHKNN